MKATIKLFAGDVISAIDDRLYSSFIEHMGRAVYTGIYEPEHPTADKYGFRQDVISLIKPLGLSHIRYPGGNFLSGYDWKDGIGPREQRPTRPELAWFALESNQVGTDEFLSWCERVGVSPMMGVNLGTGTPQSAKELLEYVNSDLPTQYADLRRRHGHKAPYGVKLWCLGNEMDGPWQICGKTAEEYGRTAYETAKLMKWLDPSISLVACGSSYREMPTYGMWERTVLEHCFEHIDFLSLHQYYRNDDGDIPSFLARSMEMDGFIKEVASICSDAAVKHHSGHRVYLSFDEWNVWYHFQKEGKQPPRWTSARPIEEEAYDTTDALLVGCMLNTLINNSDVVKIACLAQLVNTIAPIMTEPGGKAWVQTIYYPFLYASRYGRGTALKVQCESPAYACSISGSVPYIDSSAVLSREGDALTLFLINRGQQEAVDCSIELGGFEALRVAEHTLLHGEPSDVDTADSTPFAPQKGEGARLENGKLLVTLPPFSWNMVHMAVK